MITTSHIPTLDGLESIKDFHSLRQVKTTFARRAFYITGDLLKESTGGE
ncbi:uncharacterized protein METZ01_LOCUS140232 [marine metagenome]|uniref:Uncharacterized protein n=1 Tax=marine metagenome TaxID=408172 RepID=A0A381ZDK0_9ZZZZ